MKGFVSNSLLFTVGPKNIAGSSWGGTDCSEAGNNIIPNALSKYRTGV
jgi:hypothetical protein